ncbi:hypothetical protein ONZ43_g4102 [Nemania bipapillata]|uniref:Uncharacterized protein n=1 Tax=Nemania bipapillata TaxID=110536 RepID=A0ACC2IRY6_9PEZI|nr:hypothetical protein ONZ43_g4102 [Nemania bipapillata]
MAHALKQAIAKMSITIAAIDIPPDHLKYLSRTVEESKWTVAMYEIAFENLVFADQIFDVSIANFVLLATSKGGLPAVREMYPTLQPGDAATLTSWAHLEHIATEAAF